jgi:hypothetical protein
MSAADNLESRWLTPDLLGGDITNPQSLNRYAYALNNPETLTDPLGLQSGLPPCGALVICITSSAPYPGGGFGGGLGGRTPYAPLRFPGGGMPGSGFPSPLGGVFDTPATLGASSPGLPSPPACTAQASAFVSANGAYANQIAQTTGVSSTNLLGLAALESNFGTSNLATNYNNYFGLTVGTAFKGTIGVYTTADGRSFGTYPPPGFLNSGLSFAQSFQGARVSGVTDPATFAGLLTTPPLAFNSEPGYAGKLISRINQVSPCQ